MQGYRERTWVIRIIRVIKGHEVVRGMREGIEIGKHGLYARRGGTDTTNRDAKRMYCSMHA